MTTLDDNIKKAAAIETYAAEVKAYLESLVDDDPPVDPPPTTDKPLDIYRRINEAKSYNFEQYNGDTGYVRALRFTVWTKDVERMYFDCQDFRIAAGGRRHDLVEDISVLIKSPYGETITEVSATIGDDNKLGWIDVDTTSLPNGHYVLDIVAADDPEGTSIPYDVFVYRGGEIPKQDWVPVLTPSKEIHDWFHMIWVPAKDAPLPWPLPQREFPAFGYIPRKEDTFVEMLTGEVTGHVHRLSKNKDNLLTAATPQDYFFHEPLQQFPRIEVMGGPRGANAISMLTYMEMGNARLHDEPGSPLMHTTYFMTSWGHGVIDRFGTVRPIAGWWHEAPASYWEDKPVLKLYGDWSDIDPETHGCREAWGGCHLPHSVLVDHDAEPVMDMGVLRQPHVIGPEWIAADTRNNRLLKFKHSKDAHGVEPKVTIFYEGHDLYDCKPWRDKIIASERGTHRIIVLNLDGSVNRVLLEGEPLAYVRDSDRRVIRKGTLEECRNQDVVAPERLRVVGDWCYYSSAAQEQVRKVHIPTGSIEIPVENLDVRWFTDFDVSDGTTGPEGTIFASTFNVGKPQVYTPDGRKWALEYPGVIDRGRGSSGFSNTSYAWSVACGHGRIVYSSAFEGVRQLSLANENDPVIDAAMYAAGKQEWIDKGYHLSHGTHGASYFGLELPWGESKEMDYYLESLGHVK